MRGRRHSNYVVELVRSCWSLLEAGLLSRVTLTITSLHRKDLSAKGSLPDGHAQITVDDSLPDTRLAPDWAARRLPLKSTRLATSNTNRMQSSKPWQTLSCCLKRFLLGAAADQMSPVSAPLALLTRAIPPLRRKGRKSLSIVGSANSSGNAVSGTRCRWSIRWCMKICNGAARESPSSQCFFRTPRLTR